MKIFKGILIGAVGTFIGELGYVVYRDWKRSGLPFPEFIKKYKELEKEWEVEDAKEILKEKGLYKEPSTNDEVLDLVKDKVNDTVDETKEITKDTVEEVSETVVENTENKEDNKEEK